MKSNKIKIVLASKSKQRRYIFNMLGIKYEVVESKKDEKSDSLNPYDYVKDLSRDKARSVQSQLNYKAIIIAADTIIYMDGKIYEKPKNKQEAFMNMKEMSGKRTQAITGVTIIDMYQNKEDSFSDIADVYLNEISDEDIKWYIENEENLLNVCGYAMLGKASFFLDKVDGDYNTLFGISPSKIYKKLQDFGYRLSDFELNN